MHAVAEDSASRPPSAAASAPMGATITRPRAEGPAVSSTTGMSRGRAAASTAAAGRVPDGLQDQAEHPGLRQAERVLR